MRMNLRRSWIDGVVGSEVRLREDGLSGRYNCEDSSILMRPPHVPYWRGREGVSEGSVGLLPATAAAGS